MKTSSLLLININVLSPLLFNLNEMENSCNSMSVLHFITLFPDYDARRLLVNEYVKQFKKGIKQIYGYKNLHIQDRGHQQKEK